MEKEFFHWITKRLYPRSHRYPRRQVRESSGLIGEFSNPDFTRAVGQHGELLFEAALANREYGVYASLPIPSEKSRLKCRSHSIPQVEG